MIEWILGTWIISWMLEHWIISLGVLLFVAIGSSGDHSSVDEATRNSAIDYSSRPWTGGFGL